MTPEEACKNKLADYAGCKNCIELMPKFAKALLLALSILRQYKEIDYYCDVTHSRCEDVLLTIEELFSEPGDRD